MSRKYLDQFLSLRCAGDVLNEVGPINNAAKEITESMAVITTIRGLTLNKPMHYSLVDMCAGNQLTGVLAAYLLPVKDVIGVDIRIGKSIRAKRYRYVQHDIIEPGFEPPPYTILVAVHACEELALRVIDLYLANPNYEHFVLMPCCIKRDELSGSEYNFLRSLRVPKPALWALHLAQKAGGRIKRDMNCISPANYVITASKEDDIGTIPIN